MENECTDEAILRRALGYPYARPDTSFVFARGRPWLLTRAAVLAAEALFCAPDTSEHKAPEWSDMRVQPLPWEHNLRGEPQYADPVGLDEVLGHGWTQSMAEDDALADRIPVLAIGSNAAPEQLARKFSTGSEVVVVILVRLYDYDIVFAPMVSAYGSVPATISRAPGMYCDIAVTLLSRTQLVRMHATEHAYTFVRLNEPRADVLHSKMQAAYSVSRPLYVYVQSDGALAVLPTLTRSDSDVGRNNSPIGLAEICASGSSPAPFPRATQEEIQAALHALLYPDEAGTPSKPDRTRLSARIIERVKSGPAHRQEICALLAARHCVPWFLSTNSATREYDIVCVPGASE
ncbi:hypothetical protein FVE85_3490 [Porphyridium purpureum]|uniref:Uncharacterized protein n=1 Tax=Porphyridium purpureum TaxID=35688 RepID=A0A5J4YM05_PORPP|nr:hypothetical protein FVE85_9631 [Porphyridium purpureum]KAA8492052.1 hypothetical protein FVE85_3490 [Porphyridium purpureum]|eukprot:POR3143..scf249_10